MLNKKLDIMYIEMVIENSFFRPISMLKYENNSAPMLHPSRYARLISPIYLFSNFNSLSISTLAIENNDTSYPSNIHITPNPINTYL